MKWIFIFGLSIIICACGSTNFFESFSKQDSDEALLQDALLLIDESNFDQAISKLSQISSDYKENSETKTKFYETNAAAYAGKCGLIFTDFASSFGGSGGFIAQARNAFLGKLVDAPSCGLAQASMEALGSNAVRTANQNFFMAILGLAKLGTLLRASSDSTNSGTADPLWSGCAVDAGGGHGISDDDVKFAFTGLGLLLDNLAAIGGSVSGLDSAALSTFADTCATLVGVPCSLTATSSVTDPMVKVFRKIIDSPTDGIGSCSNAVGAICCATDP